MKQNYYLFVIFVILICLSTICQSQQLAADQKSEAIQMIKEIHDITITTDPCDSYPQYFICHPINDGKGTDDYTITEIYLQVNPVVNPMTTDYSVFKNLTNLSLGSSIKTEQNIMNIAPQLIYLNELHISYQDQEIDSTLEMPQNLDTISFLTISVPLPPWIFSSGRLQTLTILDVGIGFVYPTQFESSEYLTYLTTVQSHYSGTLPANTGEAFPSLKTLVFTVYNDRESTDYVDQVFPTFSSFNVLESLEIYFNNEVSAQLFIFEQTLTTAFPKLSSLKIYYQGFINKDNSTVIDFSNQNDGFYMFLSFTSSAAFFGDCKTSCLLLPKDSSLSVQSCKIDLSKINFSNITKFNSYLNFFSQTLPVTTINFPRMISFSVESSFITGVIPQEYCKFPSGALSLRENELSGDVPSCFLCGGNGVDFYILPNEFTNFNSSTNPNCSTFKIDSYNEIVKTDGTTIITITGKDFGFSKVDSPLPFLLKGSNTPVLTITVSNTEMTLWIPQGVVDSGVNLTFATGFSFESSIPYVFNYSYEVPVINGYTIETIQGEDVFILNGTGFNYINRNNIQINDLELLTGDSNSPSLGGSVMSGTNNPLQELTEEGGAFTISVEVGGQKSAIRTFYLFKSLSLVDPTSKLLSTGGSLDLTGSFSTAIQEIVEVLINGVQCTITSFSSTTIKFNYPESTKGIYQLRVNVGGYSLYSSVEYITVEKPTTPTPTTPTPTTPTTTTTSPSESSEDVSFSTKLSTTPITCFFIILLVLSLLI